MQVNRQLETGIFKQVQHDISERTLYTERGTINLMGPVSAQSINRFVMCVGLAKFRQPQQQHQALMDIANLPEGQVFIACHENTIVGYITFHYPEFERWAQSGILSLLELGAIEVSSQWRETGIAGELVKIPFYTDYMEDKIIVSMECYWFWDLQGSNLSPWEYRRVMENLLDRSGFKTTLTDDPDICSHPANLLSVRIGSRVPQEVCNKFEKVCYRGKWML
ncbi:N-acetyltransferase [Dethiobacter alkaliphilus]|uniref:N-acetyltransferase n=1 Tax=Dethiobacter alkaliphilus TaxID=427926 RepID=UPI0022280095|nr:N-acetyltransferase [Dethiobacter alkaliphilus]MCW3491021.1 N-acetyltransferase [Dethiobacter alkaliphilus]